MRIMTNIPEVAANVLYWFEVTMSSTYGKYHLQKKTVWHTMIRCLISVQATYMHKHTNTQLYKWILLISAQIWQNYYI